MFVAGFLAEIDLVNKTRKKLGHALVWQVFIIGFLRSNTNKPQRMQAPIETRVVSELSPEVIAAFEDAKIVALDVEGVDLSRAGEC